MRKMGTGSSKTFKAEVLLIGVKQNRSGDDLAESKEGDPSQDV